MPVSAGIINSAGVAVIVPYILPGQTRTLSRSPIGAGCNLRFPRVQVPSLPGSELLVPFSLTSASRNISRGPKLYRVSNCRCTGFRCRPAGIIIATGDGETITFNTKPTLRVVRETNTNPDVINT